MPVAYRMNGDTREYIKVLETFANESVKIGFTEDRREAVKLSEEEVEIIGVNEFLNSIGVKVETYVTYHLKDDERLFLTNYQIIHPIDNKGNKYPYLNFYGTSSNWGFEQPILADISFSKSVRKKVTEPRDINVLDNIEWLVRREE